MTTRIIGTPPASYLATIRELRKGLGVEDIAIAEGIAVDVIRKHVAAMRLSGDLARIYRGAA